MFLGREIVATLWDAHAWLWHGYELWGLENLPTEGGCILLYYHGAFPVDYYYPRVYKVHGTPNFFPTIQIWTRISSLMIIHIFDSRPLDKDKTTFSL